MLKISLMFIKWYEFSQFQLVEKKIIKGGLVLEQREIKPLAHTGMSG